MVNQDMVHELTVLKPWIAKLKELACWQEDADVLEEQLSLALACFGIYYYNESALKLLAIEVYVDVLNDVHPGAGDTFNKLVAGTEYTRWGSSFAGLVMVQRLRSTYSLNRIMEHIERRRYMLIQPAELLAAVHQAVRMHHYFMYDFTAELGLEDVKRVIDETAVESRTKYPTLQDWQGNKLPREV